MTNAEMIAVLRYCGKGDGCHECPINREAREACFQIMADAVDALEAAEKRIAELEAQMPKDGEWIDENRRTRSSKFVCSTCKRTCYDIQPTRDKAWAKRCRYRYCPNCGARMQTVTDCHTLEDGER